MAIGYRSFVSWLCSVTSGIKDVLDTLIAGSGRKGECFSAGSFQPIDRILVGQFQKPHTAAVGPLFYTFGGKDRIYYLTGTGTDPLHPFAESVAVPFKVLLVGRRHMLCNCAVLPLAPIKATVGCNPVVVVKNFNGFICNSHINFVLYIFMWN